MNLTIEDAAAICYGSDFKSAKAPTKALSHIVEVALDFHDARAAQAADKHSADKLQSNAYLAIEGALSALRAEGTQLAVILQLEQIAHELAPTYERHRNRALVLQQRYFAKLKELGELRVSEHQLRREAEAIGTDDVESEDIAIKLDEVAQFLEERFE